MYALTNPVLFRCIVQNDPVRLPVYGEGDWDDWAGAELQDGDGRTEEAI